MLKPIVAAPTIALLDTVPTFLKNRKQWLMWRYEKRSAKTTKVPYQPNGRHAKTNDPSTWSDFAICIESLRSGSFDGIGFIFADGDGLTGIDLDHCYTDGQLEPWAQSIVDQFQEAYIEKSPSGDGLHIWCFGIPVTIGQKKWKKPGTENEQGIEAYNYTSPRYFTVTGDVTSGDEIVDCQSALDWLYQEYFVDEDVEPKESRNSSGHVDVELVREALGYISADEYPVWIKVGMALKAAGFNCDAWEDWSKSSSKYESGMCANKWSTFRSTKINIGTVFFLAAQSGFSSSTSFRRKADDALKSLAIEISAGRMKAGSVEVETALKELKTHTGIGITILRANLKDEVVNVREREPNQETFSEADIKAAEALLKKPNLFLEFWKDFKLTGYQACIELAIAGLLFLGRSLLPTSSALYCFGKSSSGKSEFILTLVKFFPHHRVLVLTKITPRYLYRAGGADGTALSGKIIVFGEMRPLRPGEDDDLQEAIRQFVSENKLSLGSVDDALGQRNVAITKTAYGPVTIAFTGTRSPSEWDDQIINRSFCQLFKHDQDSIKNVIISKATAGPISSNPFAIDGSERAQKERIWRAAFSLLRPLNDNCLQQVTTNDPTVQRFSPVTSVQAEVRTVASQNNSSVPTFTGDCSKEIGEYSHKSFFSGVEIPFLEELMFKKKRLTESDMRAFDLLKSCIAVSALLHQQSRQTKEQEGMIVLIADWQDYDYTKDAYQEMVPRTSQGISTDLIETFLDKLLPLWNDSTSRGGSWTKADIAAALEVPSETAKRWIYAWCDVDLLVSETLSTHAVNDRKSYYRLSDSCESLAKKILERGELKISGVRASSKTEQTVICKTSLVSTDELSDRSDPTTNSSNQSVNDEFTTPQVEKPILANKLEQLW